MQMNFHHLKNVMYLIRIRKITLCFKDGDAYFLFGFPRLTVD